MKIYKSLLVLLTFVAGLTISASAQTHDNVQPAKPKAQLRKMGKVNVQEKNGATKLESANEKKTATEAIQEDKKTETKSTAPADKKVEKPGSTVPVNKTGEKLGDNKNEKMKEVRRPVKKTETTKSGN